jgi:hypothetical protein
MRNVSDSVVDKGKTRISWSITCFGENRALYGVMWISLVEPDRPQMAL